jgi:hypothetical protein
MKKMIAVAVAALALTGCSKNYCDDFSDAGESFSNKYKACDTEGDANYTKPSDAQLKQCNESVEKDCTDADKEALEKAVDCLNDLPTCSASNKDAFQTGTLACYIGLINLSASCQAVLGAVGE